MSNRKPRWVKSCWYTCPVQRSKASFAWRIWLICSSVQPSNTRAMVDCSLNCFRPHAKASKGSVRIVVLTCPTVAQRARMPTLMSSKAPTGSAQCVAWPKQTRRRTGDHRSCWRTKKPSAINGPNAVLSSIGAVIKRGIIAISPLIKHVWGNFTLILHLWQMEQNSNPQFLRKNRVSLITFSPFVHFVTCKAEHKYRQNVWM